MTRTGLTLIIAILALCGLAVFVGRHAYAIAVQPDPPPTPTPVTTVALIIVDAIETPPPTAISRPDAIIYDYGIEASTIETVARALYGINDEQDKIGATCMFVNRAYCDILRADGKRLFPASISGVVKQPGEIDFYNPDAPVTPANYSLAEYTINAQITYILTKQYTGIVFPTNLLYMGFDDDGAVFYTVLGGEPWRYFTPSS